MSSGEDHQKKLAPPALPDGYRVVAIASDRWVLVAPGGRWVSSYRDALDAWRVELDAREDSMRWQ